MANVIFFGVINFLYYSLRVSGIELPEGSPDRTTVCAGDPLRGSCPSGDVIAVIDVEYGTKLTATCGLNVKTDPCCNYDSSDCFATYTDKGQQSACSGKEVCTEITIAQADVATSCDQSSYPGLNHYVTMRYHCIPEDRINAMCGSDSQTVTGFPLYLKNQDYPNTNRATSTSCSCSIEASTCVSQIQTYFVHLELADGSGSCTDSQKIKINDTGSIQTYTCSQNTNYDINLMITSSSNFITIELENSAAINDGKFWFGFEDCSQLTDPSDGTVSFSSGTSYQSVASFACNTGYSLTGSPTRECQVDGTWSNENPNCTIIDCDTISVPDHGLVDYSSGTTYGSVATFGCDTGFTFIGDVTRTCRADGSWSNSNPTCVINGLGDSCKVASDCSAVTDAICKSNVCACKDSYEATKNGECKAEEDGDSGGYGSRSSTGLLVIIAIGVLVSVTIKVVLLILFIYRNNHKDHDKRKETPIVHRTKAVIPTLIGKRMEYLTSSNMRVPNMKEITKGMQMREKQMPAGALRCGQPPMDTLFRQSHWTSNIRNPV